MKNKGRFKLAKNQVVLSRPVKLVDHKEGEEVKVELIAAGEYQVNEWWTFIIPKDVLEEAIDLFNMSPSYVHALGQHVYPMDYSEQDKIGWYSNVKLDGDVMVATANIVDTTKGVDHKKLIEACKENDKLCQLSASFFSDDETYYDSDKDMVYQKLTKITDVLSVDFVNRGFCDTGVRQLSQGGLTLNPKRLQKMLSQFGLNDEQVAIVKSFAENVEDEEKIKTLIKQLAGSGEGEFDIDAFIDEQDLTDEQEALVRQFAEEVDDETKIKKFTTDLANVTTVTPDPVEDEDFDVEDYISNQQLTEVQENVVRQFAEAVEDDEEKIKNFTKELIKSSNEGGNKTDVKGLCKELNLKGNSVRLVEQFALSVGLHNRSQIKSFAKKLRKNLSDNFNANKNVQGKRNVRVTLDVTDKIKNSMDGFFLNKDVNKQPKFDNMFQAVQAIDKPEEMWGFTALDLWNAMNDRQAGLQQLAITGSTGWAAVFDDSLHRIALQMYDESEYQRYTKLLHRVMNVNDFLEHNAAMQGAYGHVAKVAEGGTVQDLTSPGAFDTGVTVENYSGIESVTMQQFLNDHIGMLRNLPAALSGGVVRTVFNSVVNTAASVTIKTSEAATPLVMYSTANANKGVLPLSILNLITTEGLMKKQAMYGEATERLGSMNNVKYLLVPTDLEQTANRISTVPTQAPPRTETLSEGWDWEDNPFMGRVEPFVCNNWTNAKTWVAMADPATRPTFIMSFLGSNVPQIARSYGDTSEADFTSFTMRWRAAIQFALSPVDSRAFSLNVPV